MGRYAIKSPMKSKAATVVTRGQHLERQFVQATLFFRPARLPSSLSDLRPKRERNGALFLRIDGESNKRSTEPPNLES